LGKRYTEEEKRHIQQLKQQGYTDDSIAQQFNRSTNAIRNIRHRTNVKTKETQTIQQLQDKRETLHQQTLRLDKELKQLQTRRDQTYQALQVEQTKFNKKLETELNRLKETKPELFTITLEEQINKLTGQLATSFIRWLIE
jgi:IS30 family transposase